MQLDFTGLTIPLLCKDTTAVSVFYLAFTWVLIFMKLFSEESWKVPIVQKLIEWNRHTDIYKHTEAKEA